MICIVAMHLNHARGRQAASLCHPDQIGSKLRLVAHRNTPLACSKVFGFETLEQRNDRVLYFLYTGCIRVEMDQERAECRNRLDHALHADCANSSVERHYAAADCSVDLVAEFHDESRITGRPEGRSHFIHCSTQAQMQ